MCLRQYQLRASPSVVFHATKLEVGSSWVASEGSGRSIGFCLILLTFPLMVTICHQSNLHHILSYPCKMKMWARIFLSFLSLSSSPLPPFNLSKKNIFFLLFRATFWLVSLSRTEFTGCLQLQRNLRNKVSDIFSLFNEKQTRKKIRQGKTAE